jgi:hypothetical protein
MRVGIGFERFAEEALGQDPRETDCPVEVALFPALVFDAEGKVERRELGVFLLPRFLCGTRRDLRRALVARGRGWRRPLLVRRRTGG